MTAAVWPVEAPKVAAIYARISKDDDNDELGVTRQREELRTFAAQRGWVVGHEYVDNDLSATKTKSRPQYEAMIRAVHDGEFDVILVTETSRLYRRPRQLEDLIDQAEQGAISIVALRAGEIDLSTSYGQQNARIYAAIDAGEVKRMSERIKSRKAQIAKLGGWSGGPRPFGFDLLNGKLVVNRDEAKLIRQWVKQVLAGRTLTSIARELNERRVPTVRGGRWTTPTLTQILTSPRIIGYTSSKGEPIADAHWPAIVDRADWEAVAGVLAGRKRGPAPRKTLLARLVFCGICGEAMYGASRGPKRPRLYACQTSANPSRKGCGRMSVVASALDGYITGLVMETASRSNLSMVRAERHVRDSERLVREVAEDEALLSELAEDVGSRRISRAEWIAARGPIEKRLLENRAALKALGVGDQLPPGLATVDDDKWAKLSFDQRRQVLRLFVDRIVVNPIGNKAGKVFRPERVRVNWRA